MTRRARTIGAAADASVLSPALTERLIDIRDRLAEARSLTVAAWLACGSPLLSRETAAALSAITNITRKQLDDVITTLDAVIASRGAKTR